MHNRKRNTGSTMEAKDPDMGFKKIMKDIEFFNSSHMTWKEKKEMENRKVVSLGGKPPKKQRLPLSVARVMMKKQKEREQKMQEQNMILGRFGGNFGGSARKSMEKRKPEDQVLRSTEGYFKNGILDVKHLLRPATSGDGDSSNHVINKGKGKGWNGSRKKNNGKKKGGGRKRH